MRFVHELPTLEAGAESGGIDDEPAIGPAQQPGDRIVVLVIPIRSPVSEVCDRAVGLQEELFLPANDSDLTAGTGDSFELVDELSPGSRLVDRRSNPERHRDPQY